MTVMPIYTKTFMDATIHCHVPCDKWTTKYVRFMWETMLQLASRPDLLQLHCHCIGPTAVEALSDLGQSEAHQVHGATEGGSFGHAVCIMDAMKATVDHNIHVICDSDAFVVAKGWDNLVRIKVSQGIGMLGTTYEDVGGVNSGTGTVQTYKKIPTFTWSIIGPGAPWHTLDVMPNKGHQVHVSNEKLSQIYNLPIGHQVFGEAGWQLPQFIYDNNVKYEGWQQLKPSKDAVVLSGLSDYHEEYHVDGIPFVVHHRGSLRHRYRETRLSTAFFEKVDSWIANEITSNPRWTHSGDTNLPWVQLELPFEYVETPTIHLKQLITTVVEGWLKVTVDQSVTRAKSTLTSRIENIVYKVTDKISHIRVEGTSNVPLHLSVPNTTPHSLTLRNMTNVPVIIQRGAAGSTTTITSGRTALLLVDVDGVVPIA